MSKGTTFGGLFFFLQSAIRFLRMRSHATEDSLSISLSAYTAHKFGRPVGSNGSTTTLKFEMDKEVLKANLMDIS